MKKNIVMSYTSERPNYEDRHEGIAEMDIIFEEKVKKAMVFEKLNPIVFESWNIFIDLIWIVMK